jgi:hypothetical protein
MLTGEVVLFQGLCNAGQRRKRAMIPKKCCMLGPRLNPGRGVCMLPCPAGSSRRPDIPCHHCQQG